jgi:hypothetical protein
MDYEAVSNLGFGRPVVLLCFCETPLPAMKRTIERWLRSSSLARALYQGAPIVALHRVLAAVGLPGTLGMELSDFSRLGPVVPMQTSEGHSRQRVLFVIPRNFRTHATFQAGLAQALALRGADCAITTCGGIMPVCEVTWAEQETFPRCARCTAYVADLAELTRMPCYRLSDYRDRACEIKLDEELATFDVEALKRYVWDKLALGAFAIAPTRWRLRSHDIAGHPEGRSVLSGFIRGGVRWAVALDRVIDEFRPDVLVMLNGLFMEERVAWAVAERKGCRCVFFERGRDAGTVFLSHGISAPRYDITDSWNRVKDVPLSVAEHDRIMAAMQRRVRGERMVETYWAVKESKESKIREQLQLPSDERPLAVLFTNVGWDTAMQDRDVAFDGMSDWLREVMTIFERHAEWDLVIRVHPAETQVPGRESYDRVGEWIEQESLHLSKNIRIVHPEEPIDSYALMSMAAVGCVYASTVGLELAVKGTPVIVAGAAHYSGKGFTYDLKSREEFEVVLTALMNGQRQISRMKQTDLALKYAHLFFLRRTLSMTVLVEPKEARPRLAFQSFQELRPGVYHALDVMCDGILNNTEFEFPLAAGGEL